MEIGQVVIIGGGPVGSFMAALIANFGLPVTVYEKRERFTRLINVKVKKNFFKDVQLVCDKFGFATNFFGELNETLNQQRRLILIKTLEEKLKHEAEDKGAIYVCAEIKDFAEVYEMHKDSNPLVLDCAGRNSPIRCKMFGADTVNMEISHLDSILYLNLKADIVAPNVSLYPAMKNVKHIKLARLLTHKQEGGRGCVTIAATISKLLADEFDRYCPRSNREPLKPFCNSSKSIPEAIFQTICALISPLMIQGNSIKLDSVEVKKINIACGFAKKRSQGRLVCLGDAAIQLAYFQSLVIGLKHSLSFFIMLTNYCKTSGVITDSKIHLNLSFNQPKYRDEYVIEQFQGQNPRLRPVGIEKTNKRNVYMVITKMVWFGCYSYDMKHCITRQLTSSFGVYKNQIPEELKKLNLELEAPVLEQEYQRRIMEQFENDVKMLKTGVVSMPVDVERTVRVDNFMVITKGMWYGCFTYDTTTQKIERITGVSGIPMSEIRTEFAKLNEKLANWKENLSQFETERLNDIQKEMSSNKGTQSQYNVAADVVAMNSKTGLKVYELYSHLRKGYAIYPGDNDFFVKCLEAVRGFTSSANEDGSFDPGTTLLTIQELGQLAKIYHENSILTKILTCTTDKLGVVEELVKNRGDILTGGLLNNSEIKLDFAVSCMAHVLQFARSAVESVDVNWVECDKNEFDSGFVVTENQQSRLRTPEEPHPLAQKDYTTSLEAATGS